MPSGLFLLLKNGFHPFVSSVTVKGIIYQTAQRVQAVSRHPFKSLICRECPSQPVFLTVTRSIPGLLITEVSPAGKMDRKAPGETQMKDDLRNASYVLILSPEQRRSRALSSNRAR